MLYDSVLRVNQDNEIEHLRVLQCVESASTQIAQFSHDLFGNVDDIDYQLMSPFIPHSLYQAAIVQFQSWKTKRGESYQDSFNSLKAILTHFNQRWCIAGIVMRPQAHVGLG